MSKTPVVVQRLLELIDSVGFPDGVVRFVHGSVETVNTLLDHDDIEGVSFVGSTPVAKQVYNRAARSGKRVQARDGERTTSSSLKQPT